MKNNDFAIFIIFFMFCGNSFCYNLVFVCVILTGISIHIEGRAPGFRESVTRLF